MICDIAHCQIFMWVRNKTHFAAYSPYSFTSLIPPRSCIVYMAEARSFHAELLRASCCRTYVFLEVFLMSTVEYCLLIILIRVEENSILLKIINVPKNYICMSDVLCFVSECSARCFCDGIDKEYLL